MGLIKTPLNELTYQINGLAMKTQGELKPGHREVLYQRRLMQLISEAGFEVEMEKRVDVYADDDLIGYMFLDLWVEETLVVECKAFEHLLTNDEIGQTITYLAATGSPVGLLYNFGRRKLDYKRILPPKTIQEWQHHLYRCLWTPPGYSLPPVDSIDPSTIRFSVTSRIAGQYDAPFPEEPSAYPLRRRQSADNIRLSASRQQSADNIRSTYAASGVNIDAGNRAVELMRDAVKSTYGPEVLAGIGAFGGLFDASALKSMADPVLVASTDGVGTKVKLAAQAGRFESIGHDIVNHCINDILVQGARPLFFLDYIASAKIDPPMVAAIVSGMAAACREAGCALIGGETAEMPGVYQPREFDVAGTIIGVVDRVKILPRTNELRAGNVLIGLKSSGPHTNGYSLIRKVFENTSLDTVFSQLGIPLADALLEPHRSYLPLLLSALSHQPSAIKALAHLTGGGFIENIPRVLPDHLDAAIHLTSWPIPPLFQFIQERGRITLEEMFRVFNMGIGMIAIVSPEDLKSVQDLVNEETFVIGELVEGEQRVVLK
jgi:phosphoribosylformylglycinamidine cyclo-ligase/phosphoribosylamine--glycine ligase/phosphoribosylformylglycinamidine cyclo-ligase